MAIQELKSKRIEKTSKLEDIKVKDLVEIVAVKSETQRDRGVVAYRDPPRALIHVAIRRDSANIEINSYFIFQNEVNKGGRRNVITRSHPNYQYYDKMLRGVGQ